MSAPSKRLKISHSDNTVSNDSSIKSSMVWFRIGDLRIIDNPALIHAHNHSPASIRAFFIKATNFWINECGWGKRRVEWIMANVHELAKDLASNKISFTIIDADEQGDLVKEILKLFSPPSTTLFVNKLWNQLPVEEQRDKDILKQVSSQMDIRVIEEEGTDVCILPGQLMVDGQGSGPVHPYTVFTPFSRKWLGMVAMRVGGIEQTIAENEKTFSESKGKANPSDDPHLPGYSAAKARLEAFLDKGISTYATDRNYPGVTWNGSGLSPYLAIGVISIRECLLRALKHKQSEPKSRTDVDTWINELAWRDFYRHIWSLFEHVRQNKSFKPEGDHIPWRLELENYKGKVNASKAASNTSFYLDDLGCKVTEQEPRALQDFKAWQEGRTGYPLVDAAMRYLHSTGLMHNRLRMLTACFLSKHLLIDWRLGERHFKRHLLDLDEPSNNGGWQWSAGTGSDAQPYFRVFNPEEQAKKYDPEGKFVGQVLGKDTSKVVTKKIVDHKWARERAISVFRTAFTKK